MLWSFFINLIQLIMNQKINRCCTVINKNKKVIYIGVRDETLKQGDTYVWLNNNAICSADNMNKSLGYLNEHLQKGHVLKIVASNKKDKLLNIPSLFIKELKNGIINLDKLTIKYTYSLESGIHTMFAPRTNYRPKVVNNKVKLTIFQSKSKIFEG